VNKELILDIAPEFCSSRLDRYLKKVYNINQAKTCQLTKKSVIKIFKSDQQKAIKVPFNYRIFKDDKIAIPAYIKDLYSKPEIFPNQSYLPRHITNKVKNSIIYENEHLIAINKPYNLAVQQGTDVKYCLEDFFSILSDKKLYIVHRIDKETSGIIILAKSLESARALSDMFKNKKIEKKYWAIVSPIPTKEQGVIESFIEDKNCDISPSIKHKRNIQKENKDGKIAITNYKTLRKDITKNLALLEMSPITGRKHQLRIHAKMIGCPIVGDNKYSGVRTITKKLQLFSCYLNAGIFGKVQLKEEDFDVKVDF
jgi:23S rRNA pseudouridine955/2504/2580 synthase